ncbi:DUF397 domain-containing protein [Streptomyces gobiensis]|uniref:DUF397 domain-containing protein n=1 Tax=Streptomyces gobiensis TaxID=2875706 RepID=UPI001E32B74B|nr:DUF397 domain-containing protein [Streptomyces gobiensis]UGY91239.1 DUF397 domain-containing protein [Streptomyces gobiensis]
MKLTAPKLADEKSWFKSSYSQEGTEACVEVANLIRTGHNGIGVRDSKDKQGPALLFSASGWDSFVNDVRTGRFDPGLVD